VTGALYRAAGSSAIIANALVSTRSRSTNARFRRHRLAGVNTAGADGIAFVKAASTRHSADAAQTFSSLSLICPRVKAYWSPQRPDADPIGDGKDCPQKNAFDYFHRLIN